MVISSSTGDGNRAILDLLHLSWEISMFPLLDVLFAFWRTYGIYVDLDLLFGSKGKRSISSTCQVLPSSFVYGAEALMDFLGYMVNPDFPTVLSGSLSTSVRFLYLCVSTGLGAPPCASVARWSVLDAC